MPRPPTATKKKLDEGLPGKREVEPNIESAPAPEAAPKWIADSPLALAEWNALVPERIRCGIHTLLDVNQFGRYCILMATFKRVVLEVNREGAVVEGKAGLKMGAALSILLDLEKQLRALEMENGATPKSRNYLHMAPEVNPRDDAARAEFFGGENQA